MINIRLVVSEEKLDDGKVVFIAKSPDVDIVTQSYESQYKCIKKFMSTLFIEKEFRECVSYADTILIINNETTSDEYKNIEFKEIDEYYLFGVNSEDEEPVEFSVYFKGN